MTKEKEAMAWMIRWQRDGSIPVTTETIEALVQLIRGAVLESNPYDEDG